VCSSDLEKKGPAAARAEEKRELEKKREIYERAALAIPTPSMVIFGGTTGDGKCTNDIHCFDLNKNTWRELIPRGAAPPPRYGMSGFLYQDIIFIFGGHDKKTDHVYNDMWALNLKTIEWKQVFLTGKSSLDARYYHTFHCNAEGQLFLLGGRNEKHELCQNLEEYNLYASSLRTLVLNNRTLSVAETCSKDCIFLILSFLDESELARVNAVSKRWGYSARDDLLCTGYVNVMV